MTDIEKLINGTQAEQLAVIESMTRDRLTILLGGLDIPEDLEYIVTEVSVKRFNRIGSEGATSHNVEGESLNWGDVDDFADYMDEINKYLEDLDGATRGRVRFL
jgi:hypothetical protein